ncbi:MAG: hypothetical protein DRJ05_06925 [Bacteroidetes bacterium]|nr:MAG: hypothetical protein DRJ05_06925 [Bacteroidota bacterium]
MKFYKNLIVSAGLLLFTTGIQAQDADFVWANQGGNSSFTEGNMHVQNTDNGIIAAGDFSDIANFGAEEITSNGASDIFIAKFDENGELGQIVSFGSENEELLRFLNVDSEGSIVISIMFTDFINVGGTDFVSLGGQDVLLIKFNPDLSVQWAKQYGTPLTDYVKGMDIDGDGNILVFGKFKNEIDFGGFTLTSAGSTDMYIARFNTEGDVVFAFNEGGSGYEDANSITAGPNNDFFISGTFYGETIINGEPVTTDNVTGIFIAKYNDSGGFQWVEIIEGTNLSTGVFLAANTDGSVYIAGSFQDELVFGDQTLITGEFDLDVYIAKYSTNGNALWAGHGDGGASDLVTALSCDVGGNVYLAGFYLETIDFNGIIINYTLC